MHNEVDIQLPRQQLPAAIDSQVVTSIGLAALLFAIPGCGVHREVNDAGHLVRGEVYFEGSPLASGKVHFVPFDQRQTEEDELPIADGYFQGRVSEGKKLVHVTALRAISNRKGPSGEPMLEQYVPPCVPLGPMVFDVRPNEENLLEIDLIARPLPEDELIDDPKAYDKLISKNREHRKMRAAAKK